MVWFGNDDDQPMDKMTGGTLPAATWHDIMEYAHSGVDLKPLPGLPLMAETGPIVQLTTAAGEQAPKRREQLPKKSSEALGSIEILMQSTANRHVEVDRPGQNFADSAPRRPANVESH